MIQLDTIKYYNVEDLKHTFGIEKNYISSQIHSGQLPCSKVGKTYLFTEQDIIKWIENNRFSNEKESKPKKSTKKKTEVEPKTAEVVPGAEPGEEVKPKRTRKKKSEGD